MTTNTDRIDWPLLSLYMSDHISGATAGVQRMSRMAEEYKDTPHGADLARMTRELKEERAFYLELVKRRGLPQRSYRQVAAWIGERVGRLKLNGRLTGGSPMTPVLESELMQGAVLAKIAGWRTLSTYADDLGVGTEVFERFIERGENQIADLASFHEWARKDAFLAKNDK